MYTMMKVAGKFAGSAACLLVAVSCATNAGVGTPQAASAQTKGVPEWVTNPGRRYPAAHYLVAVGSGDSRRAAEDNAVAGLARIFESKIDSEETLVEHYRELMGARGNTFEATSDMDRRVRIRANQELLNVQFGESGVDGAGRTYAIAYMERGVTAGIYAKRIEENAAVVARFVTRAGEVTDAARRYAFRNAAWIVAKANQDYIRQMDIIVPGSSSRQSPGYTVDGLRMAALEAARDLRVTIGVEGDEGGVVTETIAKAVTGLGFAVVEADATMDVKATLRIEPTDLKRADAEFVRYEYGIRIMQGGVTLLGTSGNGREGHVSLSAARKRALVRACGEIENHLSAGLRRYFDRLVKDA